MQVVYGSPRNRVGRWSVLKIRFRELVRVMQCAHKKLHGLPVKTFPAQGGIHYGGSVLGSTKKSTWQTIVPSVVMGPIPTTAPGSWATVLNGRKSVSLGHGGGKETK